MKTRPHKTPQEQLDFYARELSEAQKELDLRTRELSEALDQQKATSEVLRVISNSPTDLQSALDAIAESAARLLDVSGAEITRLEGDGLRCREIQDIRIRRRAALPLRRASMIAPSEYHLAMLRIIEEAVAISAEDLGVETARRFGFDRTGADLKEEINRQMSALVKVGKITVDGSMVRAPSASNH